MTWKKENKDKPIGYFINEHLKNKAFMKGIGPGTYNLNLKTEVYPVYKHNP